MKEFICTAMCDCDFKEEKKQNYTKRANGFTVHFRFKDKEQRRQFKKDLAMLDFESGQSWWEKIIETTHIAAERTVQNG